MEGGKILELAELIDSRDAALTLDSLFAVFVPNEVFFSPIFPFCGNLIALCPSAGVALFIRWPSGPVILQR